MSHTADARNTVAAEGTGLGDDELVRLARGGDDQAFDILFRRHYTRVANFAYRLEGSLDEAEDVAQTAFVRAHANLGRIRDGQAFLAWLYRTTLNIVRDRAKSARRKPLVRFGDIRRADDGGGDGVYEGTPDPSLDPARITVASQLQQALEEAIAALPMEFREPLVMHHLQHMDVEDIASILGVPTGTVKSRLSRARARLREALGPWFRGE